MTCARAKSIGSLIVLVLMAQPMSPAGADDAHYRPHVSGKPAGTVVGTLAVYGQGMASGALDVRTAGGKVVQFYTAAWPFTIDGKTVRCPIPPAPPAYRLNPNFCSSWPSYVKIGVTRVRVPYWRGTRYGKATLIARGLSVPR